MPSDLSVKLVSALGEGRHRVAKNLYLLTTRKPSGTISRSWVFIYTSPKTGRRVDMGLGSAELVSVARAKELALRHRLAILEGRDPLEERRAKRPAKENLLTFRQVAELYHSAHERGWRSAKHGRQWSSTLEAYACPVLGDLPVVEIDTGAVMRVLEPIWHEKPETAARVRGRIETVLDYAKARHWRQGDNPAQWKGHIGNLLPPRAKVWPVKHHAALGWRDLPALWADLATRDDISALALKFTLLTAVRTNEARGARWDEFDLRQKVWTVPDERMKAGREFRVPLTAPALRMLDQLAALRQGEYLFPGARAGRPIGTNAMALTLHRLRPDSTVHGMRSAFRDWAAEHGIAGEVAEGCLPHAIENKVEAAYRRGDLLEPRRLVGERWARFLATPPAVEASKIVVLQREATSA
jgi:integrase